MSLSCGFHDSAYFINCFRAMYGVSPLKYRREYGKMKDRDLTEKYCIISSQML
ncbi:MAG: AraC family transcriptional regulator [Oscillospiraceae bacterium]|nr:AraC family transcriptional regulator [Oscillospiraceae bacterium]